MQFLTTLLSSPLFRKIAVISALVGAFLIGFYTWLHFHDKAVIDRTTTELNAHWEKKLAEAEKVTKIDTVWRDLPPQKPTTQTKPANVIAQSEHKRLLDSIQNYWTQWKANKDSLLEIYTADRQASFEDTLQNHIATFTPLGTFGRIPLSFTLASTPKPQRVPEIHTSNIVYLIPETPWYDTKTAHFLYGIATASAIGYGASQIK